jgi:hypothetical protein
MKSLKTLLNGLKRAVANGEYVPSLHRNYNSCYTVSFFAKQSSLINNGAKNIKVPVTKTRQAVSMNFLKGVFKYFFLILLRA